MNEYMHKQSVDRAKGYPCTACMQTLCAYGIEEIYFRDIYKESAAPEIAKTYGIKFEQITQYPMG